jgi:hypothetical protein
MASTIAAEIMAMNAILVHVLRRMAKSDPKLSDDISAGFDDAANLAEQLTIAPRKTPTKETAETLRIIEILRVGVFGNHGDSE